jgi:aclacinomycin oxidase
MRNPPIGAIGPEDPRYHAVVDKRFNKRFAAQPEYVQLAESTERVVDALQHAVDGGGRVTVTSGGHCLEGFVAEPRPRVIIDVSPMKRIYFDAERGAIAVEAGATVGEVFRVLHDTWGVVIPLGEYPGIGIGGHVAGGAFGFLCRQLGLAADYLHAVEVVVVDEHGRAHAVVGTREPKDPHHDLWWAHTGAGGGNFGIVTRYWFRSAGATSAEPTQLLPRAPESITTFTAEWSWDQIDEASFARLLDNHGTWCARNSGSDSPNLSLWTLLALHRKQFGKIFVRGLSTASDANTQIDAHLVALGAGLPAPREQPRAKLSWLGFALNPFPDLFAGPAGGVSVKLKDALLKEPLTDAQIRVAYRYLTRDDVNVMGGMFGFATYGGRINGVAPEATASAQRSAILDMACNTGWIDPRDADANLAWVRAFYRELFADTGGVPTPNEAYDGAFINHPDVDLADPTLNTSGVPWYTLYYQMNYARLQLVKARWDPRNVFHHALSIRAADD